MDRSSCGWVGKTLRVDLSSGKTIEEPSEPRTRKFVGGVGLAASIFWDEVGPDIQPFDPENRLLFTTGPLTGTLAPTSGRMEVCTKAPGVEPPSCTRSGIGASFAPELKFAGYDALIIQGKAPHPVCLVIDDGTVDLRDARELWGKDTYVTQEVIASDLGQDFRVVCIGPAGENLVHYAAIISETGYAAAKAGMGAVMGSKNLKAIAVKGTGGVKIARPEEFRNVCKATTRLIANHPVKKWTCQGPIASSVEFAEKYRKGFTSCWGCPVHCRTWIEYPGLPPGEMMCLASYYLWLGAPDKEAWEGKVLADKLGLCQYQLYDIIRWMEDCYKAGIITERETGIQWSKIGSSEFISTLLTKIATREGFGDVIADRPGMAARNLGPQAVALHEAYFPGYSSCQHYSVRMFPEILMQWATDNKDPLTDAHDWTSLVYWAGLSWPREEKGALSRDELYRIAREIYGSELAADPYSYDHKAQTCAIIQNSSRMKNSLVLCDWSIFPILSSPNTPDHRGDPHAERKLYAAATGEDMEADEWLRKGERIFNLERAITAREGRRKADDTVRDHYFTVEETGLPDSVGSLDVKLDRPAVVDRGAFEKMRAEYYELRGFDLDTGLPTVGKLKELDLEAVADALVAQGIISTGRD